jgi:hypothetical protein
MAENKYVVKKLDTNINMIWKLKRYAEMKFVLSRNWVITKCNCPTETAIRRMKL